MRVRVTFEYQAGVCLWADDAEARARWTSAIDALELGLPAPLAAEAEALMQTWDAAFDREDPGAGLQWSAEAERAFETRMRAWADGVQAALSLSGVEFFVESPEGLRFAENFSVSVEPQSGAGLPAFEGSVLVCFGNEETRGAAAAKYLADYTWQETATWAANGFPFRENERTPAELLAALERERGFLIGWWQEREGGPETMLAGDPVEHAIECVRTRNATGLANFLEWERVQRVHLGELLDHAAWMPSKNHRLVSEKGSVWAWFSFIRNATAAVKGEAVSDRYKNSERDRLWWEWTRGGSRRGWPATWAEALERIGLRREKFSRWTK